MRMSTDTTTNRIKWADLYFAACSEKETFEDVTIVTAKSEYANLAFQAAAELILQTSHNIVQDDVLQTAQVIMDAGKVHIQEYVRVNDVGITVCINAVSVEDEDVVWRALDMLADALQHLDGSHGTVYFGNNLQFSSAEVQIATTH